MNKYIRHVPIDILKRPRPLIAELAIIVREPKENFKTSLLNVRKERRLDRR